MKNEHAEYLEEIEGTIRMLVDMYDQLADAVLGETETHDYDGLLYDVSKLLSAMSADMAHLHDRACDIHNRLVAAGSKA